VDAERIQDDLPAVGLADEVLTVRSSLRGDEVEDRLARPAGTNAPRSGLRLVVIDMILSSPPAAAVDPQITPLTQNFGQTPPLTGRAPARRVAGRQLQPEAPSDEQSCRGEQAEP
jgi:hypothetical protein